MFNCTGVCNSYSTINDYWRSTSISSQTDGFAYCDNTLAAGWYRLLLNGNNANMVNSPPPEWSCSTHAPIWWKGKRHLNWVLRKQYFSIKMTVIFNLHVYANASLCYKTPMYEIYIYHRVGFAV